MSGIEAGKRRASPYWITFALQLARRAGIEITADEASVIGLEIFDQRKEAYNQGLDDAANMPKGMRGNP